MATGLGMRMGIAVVTASAAAALTACGGDDGTRTAAETGATARAAERASAAPESSAPSLSPKDARAHLVKCMRDNGVAVRPGEGNDPKKLEDALDKCRSWLVASGALPDLRDPKGRARYAEFARCMREQGVNLPDPTPDGRFRLPTEPLDESVAAKARKACQAHLGHPPGNGS